MYSVCIYGGNGKIGTATARCLNILGYAVDSIDVAGGNDYTRYNFYHIPPEDMHNIGEYDAIINCGPYEMSHRIRKAAKDAKTKYIDFGGDIKIEEEIRDDIAGCEHGVMTGVGIAPGYINLMASSAVKFLKNLGHKPKKLYMYTGGISVNSNDNILGWKPTWSVEGLLKSYNEKSKIIIKGNIEEVEALSEHGNIVYVPRADNTTVLEMEKFINSGGLSHTLYEMLDENLEECIYYTLRWPGHVKCVMAMTKMKEHLHMTDSDFAKLLYDICNTKCIDIVLCSLYLYYQDPEKEEGNYSLDLCKQYFVPHDDMSAMQVATCISGASMIDFIVKENMKGFITYRDLDFYEIKNTCDIINSGLGIVFSNREVSQYEAHNTTIQGEHDVL